MIPLTQKQKQLLDFINKFTQKHGFAPSLVEMKKPLKVSSPATIHQHIETLKLKGYLSKRKHQPRSLEVIKNERMVRVPLLGTIAAGQPIEAIQEKEHIAVPENKIPKSKNIYALKVTGDSMIDEGINDGDLILVKQQDSAKNGEKVVALIDNNEATLKKFYKEKGYVRLQPANKSMQPIIVKNKELSIQGVVIDIIKNTITGSVPSNNSVQTATLSKTIPLQLPRYYKELPVNQVVVGDAIEELRKIPDGSVNMTFADPPFNLNKKYGNYKDKKLEEEYIKWCEDWLTEMVRVTKQDGTIFVHNIPKWLVHFANHLNKIAIFKHWIAWDSMSTPLGKSLLPAHYGILFYTKLKKGFKFNELRSPHKKCLHCGEMIKDYGGKKSQINPHGTLLSDVWADIHRIRHKTRRDEHPCQLPEPLLERIILMSTDENDIVLDPFIGAGTTALAAKRLGRNFIGIDIDPKYKAIVEKKIKTVGYRLSNGYSYAKGLGRKPSKYLRNLTISEKEGIYPIDNPLVLE